MELSQRCAASFFTSRGNLLKHGGCSTEYATEAHGKVLSASQLDRGGGGGGVFKRGRGVLVRVWWLTCSCLGFSSLDRVGSQGGAFRREGGCYRLRQCSLCSSGWWGGGGWWGGHLKRGGGAEALVTRLLERYGEEDVESWFEDVVRKITKISQLLSSMGVVVEEGHLRGEGARQEGVQTLPVIPPAGMAWEASEVACGEGAPPWGAFRVRRAGEEVQAGAGEGA